MSTEEKRLTLIRSEDLSTVKLDFYQDEKNEIYFTRDQIGQGLEYTYPREAIQKMHSRHKPRLDRFSVEVKLTSTDGKRYNTIVYNHRGLYEICRWSEQPNADAFYDAVYDLLESIRKGDAKVVSMTDYQKMMAQTREDNIRIRKANILLKIANGSDTEKIYKHILQAKAAEIIAGEKLLPYQTVEQAEYSAAEVAEMIGMSSGQAVGRLCNKLNLKAPRGETNAYGRWIHTKSQHSAKEVPSWVYFQPGVEALRKANLNSMN